MKLRFNPLPPMVTFSSPFVYMEVNGEIEHESSHTLVRTYLAPFEIHSVTVTGNTSPSSARMYKSPIIGCPASRRVDSFFYK